MIAADPRRVRAIRLRMSLLCGLMALGLGGIVSGAYGVQVEDGDAWRELAERQRQRRLHITPKRGTLYDRNGTALAVSVEVPSISLDAVELLRGIEPRYLPLRVSEYAQRIAEALSLDPADVRAKIERRRRFVWLKRRVSAEEVARVRALSDRAHRHPIRGLTIEGEGRRYYPNRELAGPLLGFVSPEGEGKDGLELSLDAQLRGREKEMTGLRDRSGWLIFSEGVQDEQALAGHNVTLTIDKGIQLTAERELEAAVRTYEALGGMVVVVDPKSGEVLAMASSPGYNPNDYSESDVAARRNRAVVDRFEPGSTMKVFTVAAALAADTIRPTTTLYCEEGHMAIDNVVINDTHVWKWLNPTQILAHSSNIGVAKIGLGLGEGRLYEAFRRFGFGDPTGLPVPGEAMGVLRPAGRPWVQVETAAASFGQGISVTTIQLAMAMSAVANGGRLLEPILIRRVSDATGVTLSETSPHVRREPVPAHVARTLSEMLVAVTEGEGTGVDAAIPGFRVAGKTATAQKVDPATGRYTDDHYVSAFVGYVPAEQPRLTIAVVLDEPAVTHAGGTVAAPVFRRVGEMALRYLGVTPRRTKPTTLSQLAGATEADPARNAYQVIREVRNSPEASAPAPAPVPPAPLREGEVRVPDLAGLGARDAVRSALELGLLPRISGTGRVARQDPPPGSALAKGAPLQIAFEPPP